MTQPQRVADDADEGKRHRCRGDDGDEWVYIVRRGCHPDSPKSPIWIAGALAERASLAKIVYCAIGGRIAARGSCGRTGRDRYVLVQLVAHRDGSIMMHDDRG